MADEVEIPSREKVHEGLKRHLEVTLEYLMEIEKLGEKIGYCIPTGNWYVHAHIAAHKEVAVYFSEELARESASLDTEFGTMIDEAEKKHIWLIQLFKKEISLGLIIWT